MQWISTKSKQVFFQLPTKYPFPLPELIFCSSGYSALGMLMVVSPKEGKIRCYTDLGWGELFPE
jgi:hypothetical protein